MTFLQRCASYATLISLGLAATNGAYAHLNTINGYNPNPRVFNNDPGSTLTITPGGPIPFNPATIRIRDVYTGPFSGANRHDVLASSDLGATAFTHDIDDTFCFTTRLTLTDGFNSPRKEAGIRMNGPFGDMLFLVNSDAGEIVTFGTGSGSPFYIFGSNGGGNGYTPGTSILLGINHTGGGDGIGGIVNTIEFFIDRGAGCETSGPLAWGNAEGGMVDFQVGVYAQGGASAPGDFIDALFTDTTYSTTPCICVPFPLPPSITTQPQSTTVFLGSNATFCVTASGSAPLRYQWRFNETNISGATNTCYTRTNAQVAHAGSYTVVVTNSSGSITSSVVTLSVTPLRVDWFTIDGGGGTSTNSTLAISGTIGQPDAGKLSGGTLAIDGGFWGVIFAVQTPGAPLLTITGTPTNTVVVSWPSPSTGFALQQNPDLNTSTWMIVPAASVTDNGTNKFIVVNPPSGKRFYRLFKP